MKASQEEINTLAAQLLELEGIRKQAEARVRDMREQLLIAMKLAELKVVVTDKGCVMLKRATTAQRLDNRLLKLHKPDWYKAYCKEVQIPESLSVILVND